MPIFLNHLDNLPLFEIFEDCKKNEKFISGYLIFIENYKKLKFENILKYKEFVTNKLNMDVIVKFGQGHPSKYYFINL